jgi:N utilization substance protein B
MKLSTDQKRVQRSAARLYAVQALFQMEAAGAGAERVVREFETHRFGQPQEEGQELPEGHVDLFRRVVNEAVTHQARIDQMTDRALAKGWPIDRIDPTLRALFRAAGAELVAADTPPRVVISEYMDIADAFFPGEEPQPDDERPPPPSREKAFVNAVLDQMAREARPEAFSR